MYQRGIYVFYVFVVIELLSISCRSKKQTTTIPNENRKQQELVALSERLNIPVTSQDNIKLYQFVSNWLGVPHKLGKCQQTGIDCSCFVKLLYDSVYQIKLPRSSVEMYKASKELPNTQKQEGALVFFAIEPKHSVSHVGVLLKDGWFAHVSTSKGVIINNINEAYYMRYLKGIYKIGD
jgi:murein DD-endopeptidase / murein LD-carboxypeptidase